jgi:kumamolisin
MKQENVKVPRQEVKHDVLRSVQFCGVFLAALAVVILLASPAAAQSASGQLVVGNTPGFVSTAQDLGAEDPSNVISASLWLNTHNRSTLDALAQQLYQKDSPSYRHCLKAAEIKANFAPTDAEVNTVKSFLTSHNLGVTVVGPNNFFVRAQGTVMNVEKAFHVQIDDFQVGNSTYRANTSDP